MKTREIVCIGYLYILGGQSAKEYMLVREEQFTEPPADGRHGWTVIDPYSAHERIANREHEWIYNSPEFVMTNAPWYIAFTEQTVIVEDDTPVDDFEPTPSPDDPDWESIFKEEDKQNTIETPDPE